MENRNRNITVTKSFIKVMHDPVAHYCAKTPSCKLYMSINPEHRRIEFNR